LGKGQKGIANHGGPGRKPGASRTAPGEPLERSPLPDVALAQIISNFGSPNAPPPAVDKTLDKYLEGPGFWRELVRPPLRPPHITTEPGALRLWEQPLGPTGKPDELNFSKLLSKDSEPEI